MADDSNDKYVELVDKLYDYNVPSNIPDSLMDYAQSINRSEYEKHLGAPMFWIGMYIALASLVCVLAMVADLIHGFRSRKLWFPCKYFRVNASFLTIISVAIKLPMDISGAMYGDVDSAAKFGSVAFMCTMMANLLPCLATMDNTELLSNITALCVLVITLVVDVCIQIETGSVSDLGYNGETTIFVASVIVMLIVHVCSSIAILKSKEIIESKYQQGHDRASKELDQPSSPGELLTVEKLHKHVSNHWIMAESGNPQFITTCLHTTSASAAICSLITISHTRTMLWIIHDLVLGYPGKYDSDYGWSMIVIAIVQSIGVIIGTIAPISRCFATLSFKVSSKIISNHFKVFRVESYWTQKLYDWKHASIILLFHSRNLEVVIETLKRLICNFCIGLQNGVVVVGKVIAVIPFFLTICFFWCFRCMKELLKVVFPLLGNKSGTLDENNDIHRYVLQLDDEVELGKRTLKGLSDSVNRLIQKGTKSQPNNLMKLVLGKSTNGFLGVKKFDQIDDHDVPSLDCWSLPVVTLTTIAISLPNIEKEEVDSLLESVREGLEYVIMVEKSFNANNDHVSFQKAAAALWQEIRFDKKWLGNQLQNPGFQVNIAGQIVERFRDKAKNIVCLDARSKENTRGKNDDLLRTSFCANSMYAITETILLTCKTNIDVTVSQKELFNSLSSMIADIISACLTNLPQAIAMKCHTSVIEEREESVKDAAQLLGETRELIKSLQDRDIPRMNPSDMPFINKWRTYLGNP